jgi:hypothetical protein
MKKRRKNPHAVALCRLGGLVRSTAKQRANRENGRKGGLVKEPQETNRRPAQCAAAAPWSQEEIIKIVIASICARFGPRAIAFGDGEIRYSTPALR